MATVNNNTPTLRFPEFKEEWENTKLGKVAKFSKGKGISKSEISEYGINECIRYGELYTRYGEVIQDVFSKTNADINKSVVSEANDVIIPASGETQIDIATASCVMKSGVILGGDLNIIKTNKNGVFLSYYLNSKRKLDIANLAQGISVVHLYSSQLALLNLNLPTLPEQQKIATFLTTVDEKLQALKQKKSLLEQYRKGVMQQIFSQEIRFKDDNGNEYSDWEEKKLGDVCEMKNGYAFKSNSYSVNGKYNIVTISNVQNGYLDIKKINKIEDVPNECLKHQILEIGDLLISLTGNVGRVCFVSELNCLLNQRVGKLIPKNISKLFLFQLLRLEAFITQMIADSQGGAQLNLSKPDIERYEIYLPSMSEQIKIATFLSTIDEKINHCQAQITNTEVWKKGLLQGMFV